MVLTLTFNLLTPTYVYEVSYVTISITFKCYDYPIPSYDSFKTALIT